MLRKSICRTASLCVAVLCFTQQLHAGKKVYVGAKVAAAQQVSMDRIEHASWDVLLRKYVDADGLVDYSKLKSSSTDMEQLDGYLKTLSTASTTVSAKRESKLAFWINAYNAVTVRGMIREYPTTSIRNHTAKLLGYNIWHDFQLIVGGKPFSLDQMEHKILRKMSEPRIHFAIVCASVGCPRLLNEAYVPARLSEQLDTNAKDFFARSQNFRYDQQKKSFYMSAIMSWFAADFGRNQAAQLKAIAKWLPTDAAKQAAKSNSVSVKSLDYDWSINAQSSKRSRVN